MDAEHTCTAAVTYYNNYYFSLPRDTTLPVVFYQDYELQLAPFCWW